MPDLQLPAREMLPPAIEYALVSIVAHGCLFGVNAGREGYVAAFVQYGKIGVCPGCIVSRRSVNALSDLGLVKVRALRSGRATEAVEATGRGHLVVLQESWPSERWGELEAAGE